MSSEGEHFDALFAELAATFRTDGWEVRQETPPQAYLHVSKPGWGDERLDGIHLETYVQAREIQQKRAPVALHCERGCPFQESFLRRFAERAGPLIRSWPGYRMPGGCSVCEVLVELDQTARGTVERLAEELRRLQTLAPMIDETIAECLAEK